MTAAPASDRPVTATYRLQLHARFTFDDAATMAPYLADLGVSHAYLSPVLTAVPGSRHGYDVVDHDTVNPELGGREGLQRLAAACHRSGLGLVVDIVPNHMALVAPEWANAPLWQVLRKGRTSVTAPWFDVDWAALDGRFGLPVLGGPLIEALSAGELTLDTGRDDEGPAAGQPVVRYYDHVLPVAPGTESEDVAEVLARQHYLLASWRESEAVLNYRRFFEVDGLIGVRVEEPEVFERTHRLLLDLHHGGVIDGFRVDHPDGLADPQGYLATLARHCRPGTPIWVEKILEGTERLPAGWACTGTTGYDASAALQTALVDPGSAPALSRAWQDAGGDPDLGAVVARCKRGAVERLLRPEVARLHRRAVQVLPQRDPGSVRRGLVELLVAADAYRAYVRPGCTSEPEAEQRLRATVLRAREAVADPATGAESDDGSATGDPTAAGEADRDTVRALGEVLLAPGSGGQDPLAARDLAMRFQQTTGPVMAKGIEDTAFYRWHRLVALNEVGADPAHGAHPEVGPLHAWAEHQARHWPAGMTTLSTHDTKRSEDVRARVIAVAGDPQAWQRCTEAFAEAAADHGVDGPTAHLLWQTLVGAGSIDQERLAAYLTKALREAKEHTSWVDVDEGYEERVQALAATALGDSPLREIVEHVIAAASSAIRAVVLGQKLVQLTLPGLPDTYQGCELVDLSLVDPDNRRPVDYADRADRLARLTAGGPPADLSDEKLLVTSRALRLRARLPEAFGAGAAYRVLEGGEHLLGFLRGDRVATLAVRGPHGLAAAGGFRDQRVDLPAGRWRDELTGRRHQVGDSGLACADVLAALPVALLVHESPAPPPRSSGESAPRALGQV
ncbi:malto-oligosyltrehalose synthase [soil metagenome]